MPLARTRAARLAWFAMLSLSMLLSVLVSPLLLAPATAAAGQVDATAIDREVFPGQKTTLLLVESHGVEQPATVVIRNGKRAVATFMTPPACHFDDCTLGGAYDGYTVRWDGKNGGGTLVPAGAYTGTISFTDGDGHAQSESLGQVYVDHLVTKRQTETHQDALPDPSLGSFSTVGRCSSVGLGPDGARMLRLLSLRFCGSTAGSDDWAFAAQRLRHADQRGQRLVSVKVGAVGSPVAKGDFATVVADSSAGSAGSPTWRRVATLRGSGSHWGSVLTVPTTAQPHQPYSILIQGRVTDGNRYRIQWWQSVWSYRAWAR